MKYALRFAPDPHETTSTMWAWFVAGDVRYVERDPDGALGPVRSAGEISGMSAESFLDTMLKPDLSSEVERVPFTAVPVDDPAEPPEPTHDSRLEV